MNLIYKSSLRILVFFSLFACNPQAQQSLLGTPQPCTDASCAQTDATSIAGDLSIDPENSVTSQNVEKGNLVEIAGTCKDLGRKNNRIIVEAFHIEDDESILPYVNNSISSNCQINILGLTTAQQCFFVTHGNGLLETGQTYPQCINGRFSFQVRLGDVSKVGATVKSYLVRMKIRTTDGVTSESGWARTTVQRNISPPNFSVTINSQSNRCEVKIEPYKFKDATNATDNIPSITYAIKRQEVGYTAAYAQNPAVLTTPPPDRLSGFFPYNVDFIDFGDSIANFYDGRGFAYSALTPTVALSLQPGVKYNYYVQARAGADDSAISAVKTCEIEAPIIAGSYVGSVCSLTLTSGAVAGMQYQWAYSTSAHWTDNSPTSGNIIACGSGPSCTYTMPSAGTFYTSVRTHNGGGFYGKWQSLEAACKQ